MIKARDAAAQAHPTVLHWAAANGDVERMLVDTVVLRMMHMLRDAGPNPFATAVIDHGPCMSDIQKNVCDSFIRDCPPLVFTITHRGVPIKVTTFIESIERLAPRHEGTYLLCGTLAVYSNARVHARPSMRNSVFFAKGYDGKAKVGGALFLTPYMVRCLEQGHTSI
jgi:hypothetical protein